MGKFIWVILALIAGAVAPIQAGLNAKIGKAIENPIYASLISFIVGVFALLVFVLVSNQPVSWSGIKTVPVYTWFAGVLGAFFVTVTILAYPRIGPALTFALIIAGQMTIAVIFEHFNILAAQSNPINWWRVLGLLLIVAGVFIIRKF